MNDKGGLNRSFAVILRNASLPLSTGSGSHVLGCAVLPTIIFVGVLSGIGTIANIQVLTLHIVKYKSKSTYVIYIVTLAVIDLLVCGVHMPCEILDLHFPYDFYSSSMCSLFRCFNAFLTLSSTSVLVVIAIDRYRHVCYPMRQQWTTNFAKKLMFFCIFTAILFSMPSLLVFGEYTVEVGDGRIGKECFISDDMQGTIYPAMYLGMFYIIYFIASFSFIFTYSSIGLVLRRQARARFLMSSGSIKLSTIMTLTDDDRRQICGGRNENSRNASWQMSRNSSHEYNARQSKNRSVNSRLIVHARDNTKVTKIVFFITMLFIFTYLPYAVLGIVLSIREDFKSQLNTTQLALYRVAMRLCLLNNVCNCFIYSIFDKRFRVLCCDVYRDFYNLWKCKSLKHGCQLRIGAKR